MIGAKGDKDYVRHKIRLCHGALNGMEHAHGVIHGAVGIDHSMETTAAKSATNIVGKTRSCKEQT